MVSGWMVDTDLTLTTQYAIKNRQQIISKKSIKYQGLIIFVVILQWVAKKHHHFLLHRTKNRYNRRLGIFRRVESIIFQETSETT